MVAPKNTSSSKLFVLIPKQVFPSRGINPPSLLSPLSRMDVELSAIVQFQEALATVLGRACNSGFLI